MRRLLDGLVEALRMASSSAAMAFSACCLLADVGGVKDLGVRQRLRHYSQTWDRCGLNRQRPTNAADPLLCDEARRLLLLP